MEFPRAYKELFNPYWRYIVYEGGRGSLKSHSIGRSLLIRGRKKKMRFLCTREFQKSIKDSVHKLLSDLIEQYGFTDYEVQKQTIINNTTGTEFIFSGLHNNVAEIKSMEGIDVAWVEEAHSTTKDSLDILTPTIRKPGSQIIFSFNRWSELDPVYVKFVIKPPKRTFHSKINYDYALKLGWMPDVLIEEMEEDRENYPAEYAHKWLGEPLSQDSNSILDRGLILEAMNREVSDEGQEIVAADIARMGGDRIVFWRRKGLKSLDNKVMQKMRIPDIAKQLEEFVNFDKTIEIRVDDTGVGGGVTDILMADGYNVIPVNFGSRANNPDKYPNWISEAWFNLQHIMAEIELPESAELLQELSTRKYKVDKQERRMVESKDDYKKRGFRSPDLADAVIICYAPARQKVDWAAPQF